MAIAEEALRSAVEQEVPVIARELQDVLGQKLVAFAVGDKHPKTIGRYARGERTPEDETLAQLINLYTVQKILSDRLSPSAIKAWMLGANPRLNGTSPIEAIHERRAFEAMGAAKAFLENR